MGAVPAAAIGLVLYAGALALWRPAGLRGLLGLPAPAPRPLALASAYGRRRCPVLERARRHARLLGLARGARGSGADRAPGRQRFARRAPAEAVRAAFPGVELIETGANLGFAGGNNAGIARCAPAPAAPPTCSLQRLQQRRRARPGRPQRSARGGGPPARRRRPVQHDPLRRPARADLVRGRRLRPALRLQRAPARLPRARRRRTSPRWSRSSGPRGAAMLVPRAVLEAVGLFDEQLFLYVEDTDWSLRAQRGARLRGLYVVPAEQGRGTRSRSARAGRASPATLYYDTRNSDRRLRERHAPLRRCSAHTGGGSSSSARTWRRRCAQAAGRDAVAAVLRPGGVTRARGASARGA